MPDGCVDLFVSSRGDVMIAGPPPLSTTCAQTKDACLSVDSILAVRDFLMAEKVFTATTPSQRVAALQNVLTGHLADTDPLIDTAVTRAIAMMRRHPDRPR
jgi:hypothetical protein